MNMQTLDLNSDDLPDACDAKDVEPVGFWRRQFQLEPTSSQRKFDWIYGVGLPLVCVAADPVVFVEDGLLAGYRSFALVLSAASILGMAAWLLWGPKLGWLAAPISGLFIAGGAVSFAVGLMLFPYSVLGLLFFLIGFLGFTPIFSAVVFLRNGFRALHTSQSFVEGRAARHAALVAALFSLVIPYVLNVR